jgi:hypothetical protein
MNGRIGVPLGAGKIRFQADWNDMLRMMQHKEDENSR